MDDNKDFLGQIQNLQEIIEVAKQISSGLDVEYITKNVNFIISAKFNPLLKAFILQSDFDDLSPLFLLYKERKKDKQILEFESIVPLIRFFEGQEYNQISFDQFCKNFEINSIKKVLKKYSPEFIIPLRSNKSILGIYLQGKKADNTPYTMEDIQYCINIVGFASISLENAKLYREATVDRMTKLFTHHQFQEKLDKAIKKGHRYGNKFSLIMFDIDNFKKFNDKYGHLQGDIIIKEIAKILRESMREIDLPARYGGEEFAVLLPEVRLGQAYIAAERLRKTVEQFPFSGKNGPYKVTISMGVAEFDPKTIKYNEDIIDAADKALYKSKEAGRNTVTKAEN